MIDFLVFSTILSSSMLIELSNMTNLLAVDISDKGLGLVGAGVAGVGVLGAGIGQGIVGAGACVAVGRNPEASKKVMQIMFIIAGFAESGAIYALLISILLIFVV